MAYKPHRARWQKHSSEIKDIREKVFICEYRIPKENEFDKSDSDCEHVLIRNESDLPIATGRIGSSGKISRIAVLKQYRQQGIHQQVIKQLLNIAKAKGIQKVYIDSELEQVALYTKQGFTLEGSVFMDAGIPKQSMSCPTELFQYQGSILH